jgi:16S rRNA A1518/A1519 N6-dimethyltransferase RsmA/KsgA/DIM1 with predicted DNA glycosylase/AP lyase activity
VLEIGPGKGILTRDSSTGARRSTGEIDPFLRNAWPLIRRGDQERALSITRGDAIRCPLPL